MEQLVKTQITNGAKAYADNILADLQETLENQLREIMKRLTKAQKAKNRSLYRQIRKV